MAHQITVSSEHGSKLLFARMSATEQLGKLFSYQVQLLSSRKIDGDLKRILSTAVQRNPDARYRSIDEIRTALTSYLESIWPGRSWT